MPPPAHPYPGFVAASLTVEVVPRPPPPAHPYPGFAAASLTVAAVTADG